MMTPNTTLQVRHVHPPPDLSLDEPPRKRQCAINVRAGSAAANAAPRLLPSRARQKVRQSVVLAAAVPMHPASVPGTYLFRNPCLLVNADGVLLQDPSLTLSRQREHLLSRLTPAPTSWMAHSLSREHLFHRWRHLLSPLAPTLRASKGLSAWMLVMPT